MNSLRLVVGFTCFLLLASCGDGRHIQQTVQNTGPGGRIESQKKVAPTITLPVVRSHFRWPCQIVDVLR